MKALQYASKPGITVLVIVFLLLAPLPGFAACEPEGTNKSDLIICSNFDPDGVSSGNGHDFITVLLGASIDIDIIGLADGVTITAVDTGSGHDTVVNNGSITVNASATQGDAVSALVIGIDGGNGNDAITNAGPLTVDLSLESGGDATAIGISGGNGGDDIDNQALLQVQAKSVNSAISVLGLPIGDKIDASTTLNAYAMGIDSGNSVEATGNANIGIIDVTAITELSNYSADLTIAGTTDVDATITLNSHAVGIDNGNSKDDINNEGVINVAANTSISNYVGEINLVDSTHSDNSRFLFSTAQGITTGNSKDTINNSGAIIVNALSESTSGSFEANGADAAQADSELEVHALAVGIDSGRANDLIQNSGSMDVTATAEVDDINVNLSFLDVTIADGEGGSASTKLDAYSVGINSDQGNDTLEFTDTSSLNAVAIADVHSTGVALASEGVPGGVDTLLKTGGLADIGITSEATTIAIDSGIGHDSLTLLGNITSNATADASQESINVGIAVFDFKIPTPGIVIGGAGTEAKSNAFGIMLGDGQNDILNNGLLDVDATAEASAVTVSLNLAEFSKDFLPSKPGVPFGASVVGADTSTRATSVAMGITAGDDDDIINNSGVMQVDANSISGSISAAASLDIKYKEGDNFLAVDGVFARAITEAISSVTGIDTGDGDNFIRNSGSLSAASYADTTTVAATLNIAGTIKGAGGALGLAATDTSNEATAIANGIVGGDDTDDIYNDGSMNVSADTDINNVNASVAVGVAKTGVAIGVSLARSESIADSTVTGIDGADDDDVIHNNGNLNLAAQSEVDSINVSATIEGALEQGLAVGVSLVDASAEANADVTGITGAEGDDIIHNSGIIHANNVNADTNTVGVGVSLTFAKQGLAVGVALTDSTADANADVTAIDGGNGDDLLFNEGNILLQNVSADADALSVSVGAGVAKEGVAIGVAVSDATGTATTDLVGVNAGSGDDVVTNSGVITVEHSSAEAHASGISVELAGTSSGVSAGVGIADTLGIALMSASGLSGAAGDDKLINDGDIFLQHLESSADAISVGVTLNVAMQAGVTAGASLSNASADADLFAIGIEDIIGDNHITNNGLISIHDIESSTTGVGVSVQLGVTNAGVALGAALADTSATAFTSASGITTGAGDDQIQNYGDITLQQIEADADAVSVSVALNAALQGGVAGGLALTDAGAHADVIASGIAAGAGDDFILNNEGSTITAGGIKAVSDATSVSVSLSGTQAGLAVGVAMADTTATADALGKGIDGGSGDDLILNDGLIDFSTTADVDATAVSVSLNLGVAAGGVALTDASTTAEATTMGIDGAEGSDEIINVGDITSNSHAEAQATSVAVGIAIGVLPEVAVADVESTADAEAIGIYSGADIYLASADKDDDSLDEKITNVGMIDTTATADADGTSVAFSLKGYSLGESTSTATALAQGIASENGKDSIHNLGSLTATAESTAEGMAVGANLVGKAVGNATTTATATANGIASSGGEDEVVNQQAITTMASAASSAASGAVTLGGVAGADATSTATAISTGIDAGSGEDLLVNMANITAMAGDATAPGITSSINCEDALGGACTHSKSFSLALFGQSTANAAATSTSLATGMDGGGDDDNIFNQGVVSVSALARGDSKSLSITLAGVGNANASSTATATALGVTGGAGDDRLFNSSSITATAAAVGRAKSFDFTGFGTSAVNANVTTNANAIGMSGGSGNDEMENSNQITANATAFGLANGKSVNLIGKSNAIADATTNSAATGMDGGSENDILVNKALITATSNSTADVRSSTFTLAGVASSKGAITNDAWAAGMTAGFGVDQLFNEGGIDVDATSNAVSVASSLAIFGGANTSSGIKGTATAIGMASGGGPDGLVADLEGDVLSNLAWMDILASSFATANGDSFSLAGSASASAFITAEADATGISGSYGDDDIYNHDLMKVAAISSANSGQDASVALVGDAKTSADITAVATARGISSTGGNNAIRNHGIIDVSATANASANSDSQTGVFEGDGDADSYGVTTATGYGIELTAGENQFTNVGTMLVSATATMNTSAIADGSNFADGNGDADAGSSSSSFVYGVWADDGNNKITNIGDINLVSNTNSNASTNADGDGFFGDGDGKAVSRANNGVVSPLAIGIRLGNGDHTINNNGVININVFGTATASATADGDTVSAWAKARSTASMAATAYGIQTGDGDQEMFNNGDINVEAIVDAFAVSIANPHADPDGDGDTDATTATSVNGAGIAMGYGRHQIINAGNLTVKLKANPTVSTQNHDAIARGDGDSSDATADIVTTATTDGKGISARAVDSLVWNQENILVETHANAAPLSKATSDVGGEADATGNTTVTAKSRGIEINGDANYTLNDGVIDVDALATAVPIVIADTSGAAADSDAKSTNFISALVDGLLVNGNNNDIDNLGLIDVSANASAICTRSRGCTDSDTSQVDSDADATEKTTVRADASGMLVQGMDNVINNSGDINVVAQTNATSRVRAEATGGTDANADVLSSSHATAISDANGIRSINAADLITNFGQIDVTAMSVGKMKSDALGGWADGDARAYATGNASAFAYGIRSDQLSFENVAILDDTIINEADIIVYADADAFAKAWAEESAGATSDELASGTARATARSYGIYSGNGNDTVINRGLIDVTAIATASVSVDTDDNDREIRNISKSALATGIYTGAGNDNVFNYGTINTSQVVNGASSLGTAINVGGGNDNVTLGDGSVTNGNIDLGTGSDTITMEGTPVINGGIIDGLSTVSLVFNNSGSYAYGLPGVTATKNGAGMFSLNMINQMERIDVNQGVLKLNNDYNFLDKSVFQAQVYGGGSHGQFMIDGEAVLNGKMKIVRGGGAYQNGEQYNVLLAGNGIKDGSVFNSIKLPTPTPLLKFSSQQLDDSLQVQAEVKSFTTVSRGPNQRAVAENLDRILPTVTGKLNQTLGKVQVLALAEFDMAFTSLSPVAYDHYTSASFNGVQQYISTMQDRMTAINAGKLDMSIQSASVSYKEPILLAANGALSQGMFAQGDDQQVKSPYGLWTKIIAQQGEQDSDGGINGYEYDLFGITIGFDKHFSDALLAGVSVGYTSNDLKADFNLSNGDITTTLMSAYASYFNEHLYINGVLTIGKNNYDTDRNIIVGPTTTLVRSSHSGDVASATIGGGYYIEFEKWWLDPFVYLQYSSLDEEGFRESGGGPALNVNGRKTNAMVSTIGVRISQTIDTPDGGNWIPEASLAWLHDYDIDDHTINASYVGAPGASFSIEGEPVQENGIVVGLGIGHRAASGLTTLFKYTGEFRDKFDAHGVIGEMRFEF